MMDQLIIGSKASYDDFSASIAKRKFKKPAKKEIKETVPFSNKTYDFSALDGEPYWEEQELEYIFEITASDPEELEELKAKFSDWVMNVQSEEIHDPFIPDYHFKGTYSGMEEDDDESLEKTTLTVTFKAYPFKIANTAKIYKVAIAGSTVVRLVNESSHRVTANLVTDVPVTIPEISDSELSGTVAFLLDKGVNDLNVTTASSGWLTVVFYEEVF